MAAPFIVGLAVGVTGSQFIGNAIAPMGESILQEVWYKWPIKLRTHSEVLGMFITGHVSYDAFKEISRANGEWMEGGGDAALYVTEIRGGEIKPSLYSGSNDGTGRQLSWIQSQTGNPTNTEIINWFYRGFIGQETTNFLLRRNGISDANLQTLMRRAGEQIPGPSDLIRFAVREAFTPQIVQQYGYMNEIPTAILPWMKANGYGGDIGINKPAGTDVNGNVDPERSATWSDMYWWSHWELPSPSQGYEMLHRFYPNSPYGPSPESNPDTRFTSDDLSTLLRTLDYPTYWRKKLEALSYRVLTRVDVRRMYILGVLNDSGVYHAYRQQGYNDTDANKLLAFSKKQKEDTNRKKVQAWDKTTIVNYYKSGTITPDNARQLLSQLGFEQSAVDMILQKADYDLKVETVNEVIKLAKRSYYMGQINDDQLTRLLVDSGLPMDRINEYAKRWKLQREYRHKDNSTGEITKGYKAGIIEESEMVSRLYNLGYKAKEVSLISLIAKREFEDARNAQIMRQRTSQQKEQTKQAKTQESKQHKQETERQKEQKILQSRQTEKLKEQVRQQKETMEKLLAPYSEKNIIAMYKAKQLTDTQVMGILKAKEWTPTAIVQWMKTYLKSDAKTEGENEIPKT